MICYKKGKGFSYLVGLHRTFRSVRLDRYTNDFKPLNTDY